MARPDSLEILSAPIESLLGHVPDPLYHAWADAWTSGKNRDPFLAEVVSEELAMRENSPALWAASTVVATAAEVERRIDELVEGAVREVGGELGKKWRSWDRGYNTSIGSPASNSVANSPQPQQPRPDHRSLDRGQIPLTRQLCDIGHVGIHHGSHRHIHAEFSVRLESP